MIVRIHTTKQYGRMGQAGISHLSELDEDYRDEFAHSAQDALNWLVRYPRYKDATFHDLGDGRYLVTPAWLPHDNYDAIFDVDEAMKRAQYERLLVIIAPVDTIYESTGSLPPDYANPRIGVHTEFRLRRAA